MIKMAVQNWKFCALLVLMAVSAANSNDDLQIQLLDDEPTNLAVYNVDPHPSLSGPRVRVRDPYYYMGIFQSGVTYEKDNCTNPGIDDFPPDMFTEWQRQHGAIVVHFMFIIYSMVMICNAVDDYFVPSLEILANELHLSPDVAGATIMAMGTSIPELFFNIIGTFVTQGDIGVGTVVGSDVFNILAAPAYCGILSGIVVDVDWYPLTRDCLFFSIVVILQIIFVSDSAIFWWEAMILVIGYGFYILVMYFNVSLEKNVTKFVKKHLCCLKASEEEEGENNNDSSSAVHSSSTTVDMTRSSLELTEISLADDKNAEHKERDGELVESDESPLNLFERPTGSFLSKLFFYVMWLGNFLFFITIPDVRRGGIWRKLYVLEFALCIAWVGGLSYLVTWWITVIGDTLGIPDSEMGISLLAIGGSVPQGYALYVVARQGNGKMGISGAVGSNAFDQMICMGLPWMIKALVSPKYPEDGKFVVINSEGVVYSVIMLLAAVFIFYFTIALNKWRLDRKAGFILVVGYVCFIILASLFELNVFFQVNVPLCPKDQ